MPNYLQRILTAIVLFAAVLSMLLINQYVFVVGMALLTGVGLYEYVRIIQTKGYTTHLGLYVFMGGCLYVISFLTLTGQLDDKYNFIVLPFIAMLLIRSLYVAKENFTATIALEVFGLAYLVLPFVMANELVFLQGEFDASAMLLILVLTAASDIGAYVVGVNFGKRPLAAKISPKKSIEGFIGGIIITIVIAYFLQPYFDFSVLQMLAMALLVAVMGTYGDLLESKFKRDFGVKDSSNLLPGHGGFLDRFDSMIFSTAFVYVILVIFQ